MFMTSYITGMMYIDHFEAWQMTDALVCLSRATPQSPSLDKVPWARETLLHTWVSLSLLWGRLLQAPVSCLHSCKGFGIKEDLPPLPWLEQKILHFSAALEVPALLTR